MVKFFKTYWRLILIVLVPTLICLLLFPETPKTRGTQISHDTSLEKLGIVAQSWVDASIVGYGESINYSLMVYNTGASELQDLCVSLNAPGFSDQQDEPECFAKVPAATSANINRRLRAISRSGQYRITASYQAMRQGLRLRSAISVDPVQMTGWFGQAMWTRFMSRLALLATGLALPLVLTGLGLLFQRWQQGQEVRNTMLQFVQALAEKHYMPIARAAILLITDGATWKSETDPERTEEEALKASKRCFYDLVVVLKRMTYLRKDKGQVFFQNRPGEIIFRNVWTIARSQCRDVFTEEGISALTLAQTQKLENQNDGKLAESIDIDYAAFVNQLADPPIADHFQKFYGWIAKEDFKKFLNLMNVLQAVLIYESNRPFNEYWYDESNVEGLEFINPNGSLTTNFPQIEQDFPSEQQHKEQLNKLKSLLESYKASTVAKPN